MIENSANDIGASSGERWRPVHIAPPRRLIGRTYAMIAQCDGGEETIARDVTIAQALVIALEHGGAGAALFYRDRGGFREYVVGRSRPDENIFHPVLRGVVPRSADKACDHVRALEFFEEILEHDPRVFFDGRLDRAKHRAKRRTGIGEAT